MARYGRFIGIACGILWCLGSGAPGPAKATTGQDDTGGTYPYVVYLKGPVGDCSGTLIDPVTVVTASHCFVRHDYVPGGQIFRDPADYKVSRLTPKVSGRPSSVSAIFLPDAKLIRSLQASLASLSCPTCGGYHTYYEGDMAVVRLADPIVLPKYPRLLTESIDKPFVDELRSKRTMNWSILRLILQREFKAPPKGRFDDSLLAVAVGAGPDKSRDAAAVKRSSRLDMSGRSRCTKDPRNDYGGDWWCFVDRVSLPGDSGGPLLLFAKDGRTYLAGVLTGSTDNLLSKDPKRGETPATIFSSILTNLAFLERAGIRIGTAR